VTCVCQRTEVLAGLFALLTLYCLARGWRLGAIAACGLAMGCKESVVALPIIAVLYDRLFIGRPWRERWMFYAGLAATWAIPFFLLPLGNEGTAIFGDKFDSIDYALPQFRAVVRYIALCFWPSPLVIDYGWGGPLASSQIIPYLLALTLLVAGVAVAWRYQPWLGFLGVFFFLILAPSSSVIPCADQIAAEKRMYLPLIAVVIPVVLLARRLRCPAWLGALTVLLLAILTFQRNLEYTSPVSIWQDAAIKMPKNPRAYNNLGCSLGRAGLYQDAAVECYKAIQLDRTYADAYHNLGLAYEKLGKPDKAKICHQLAAKYNKQKRPPRAIAN
jgi:protein O-mannosyl-transferase